MADWKLKYVFSPQDGKLYKIDRSEGRTVKKAVETMEHPKKGKLLALHTAQGPDGVYAIQEFEKGVSLSKKSQDGKGMTPIGDFPSKAAAEKAADKFIAPVKAGEEPGISDPKHFSPHPKSSDPLKPPEPKKPEDDYEGEESGFEEPRGFEAGEDQTAKGRQRGEVEPGAIAKEPAQKGTGHRVGGGLPVKGGTHEPGADVALAAAGYRSAIEKVKEPMLKFLDKYKAHLQPAAKPDDEEAEAPKVNVEKLRKEIEDLDKVSSEQLMARVNTLGGQLHELFVEVRRSIGEKVKQKHWSQKFPKFTEAQLKAALRKAQKSEKYQKDADVRAKVNSAVESIRKFYEGDPDTQQPGLKDWLRADPEFKELESDYTMASGAIRVAQMGGGKLATSTKGGQEADKTMGVKHQRMRPMTGDNDEIIGFTPMGDPETKPKQPITSLTPTWQKAAGQTPEKEMYKIDRQIYDIMKKYDNDLGLVRQNKHDWEELQKLKAQKAKMKAGSNFQVRKGPAETEIDPQTGQNK